MSPPDTTSNQDDDLTPEEAALVEAAALNKQRVDILDKLASKVEDLFQKRASRRAMKEIEWDKAQQLYNAPLQGSNSSLPETPFDTNATKPRRPEPNIVRTKCDVAISNCISLQFAADEKNWDLFPPANVSDPAITQACRLMSKEIEAQLCATKYAMHSRRAMEDRVILGTGVLKGPVNTGKMRVQYTKDADGTWIPEVSQSYTPKLEHVSLWRFYPDDSVTDFSESEDVIEVHPMTPIELSQYIKHPGFDADAIKSVLLGDHLNEAISPTIYNDSMTGMKAAIWARNPYLYKDRYLVLEYHGPVTYDELSKLGLEPTYNSPTAQYYGEVWVCCGKVIRMELENIEGYYETPYSCSVWKRDPSSPYGYGHPLLLADAQQVVTSAYHMILDNASLTSGPQVAMYQKYIQPVDGNWNLSPNKAWLLTDPTVDINKAIQFFNPTNVIGEIMPVLQLARQFADEESATMAFGGLQSPQATESATGSLLMQHASTTLLDFMAEEWDDQVTEKVIRRYYAWNMQYNPKEEIKGDYYIDVRSSSEYKNKQMYIRDLERLQMETAQNPMMAMAVNSDELVKARLALMHLPSNKIIKTPEEIKQAEQKAQNKPDPAMLKLQIEQGQLQVAQQTLQLKAKQLQFDAGLAQQRAQWEHEEKMGSNQARLAEANASVLKAQLDSQTEALKLQQKDVHGAAQLATKQQIAELDRQATIYTKGMEEQRAQQDLDVKAAAVEVQREQARARAKGKKQGE